jgi:hypothetical protein
MNFDAGFLTVDDGKGQKDRTVPLPQTILPELRAYLEPLKVLHQNDLNRGYAGGFLVNALEWKIEKGRIVVSPVQKKFLQYRNAVKTGRGDISGDIERARNLRVEEDLEAGAKKGKKGDFRKILAKVSNRKPLAGDEVK